MKYTKNNISFHINYKILLKNSRAFWQYRPFTSLSSFLLFKKLGLFRQSGKWAYIGSSHNEQIKISLKNITPSPNFSPRIWTIATVARGAATVHDFIKQFLSHYHVTFFAISHYRRHSITLLIKKAYNNGLIMEIL